MTMPTTVSFGCGSRQRVGTRFPYKRAGKKRHRSFEGYIVDVKKWRCDDILLDDDISNNTAGIRDKLTNLSDQWWWSGNLAWRKHPISGVKWFISRVLVKVQRGEDDLSRVVYRYSSQDLLVVEWDQPHQASRYRVLSWAQLARQVQNRTKFGRHSCLELKESIVVRSQTKKKLPEEVVGVAWKILLRRCRLVDTSEDVPYFESPPLRQSASPPIRSR